MKNLLLLLLFVSCGNYTELKEEIPSFSPGGTPGQSAEVEESEIISFAEVKSKVIDSACLQCHPGYSDYDTVKGEIRNILSQVSTNRMPKNAAPLSDELKTLLRTWFAQGTPLEATPNQDGGNKPPTDVQEEELIATWDSVSKKVIFPKCVTCHNPGGQAGFLDLSSRQAFFDNREFLLNNFQNPEQSYLIEVITDPEEPMPPLWSSFPQVTPEEVEVLKEWIIKGLP